MLVFSVFSLTSHFQERTAILRKKREGHLASSCQLRSSILLRCFARVPLDSDDVAVDDEAEPSLSAGNHSDV